MVDGNGREGVVVSRCHVAVNPSASLLRQTGVQVDLPIVWIDDDFSKWDKHRQIHVCSYGNLIPEECTREGLTTRTYHGPSGPELSVVFTLQVVMCQGSEAYGEIRYTEGGANFSLTRIDPDRPLRDLEPVRRALRVAFALEVSTRGKKQGDGATWAGGNVDFLDDLWTTLETLVKETGRPFGHDPASRLFRSKMREHPGERVLRTWLGNNGLRPKDVKAGKVTRANYVQFVAK
jgi:hypothetical protein